MSRRYKSEHTYEIRDWYGETVCVSPLPQLGYSDKLLAQIVSAGYCYCIDGKVQPKGNGGRPQ